MLVVGNPVSELSWGHESAHWQFLLMEIAFSISVLPPHPILVTTPAKWRSYNTLMDFIWVVVFHPNGGVIVVITTGISCAGYFLGTNLLHFTFPVALRSTCYRKQLSSSSWGGVFISSSHLWLFADVWCAATGTLWVYTRCPLTWLRIRWQDETHTQATVLHVSCVGVFKVSSSESPSSIMEGLARERQVLSPHCRTAEPETTGWFWQDI